MDGIEAEQAVPRLPRAESVLGVAPTERRGETVYRAFGLAADDFARHLAMLEVRLRTGDRHLFAYHLLGRAKWSPSSEMTLVFGDEKITLKGRNLGLLFTAIRDNKASWIEEASLVIAELVAPTVPLVESVAIEVRASASVR